MSQLLLVNVSKSEGSVFIRCDRSERAEISSESSCYLPNGLCADSLNSSGVPADIRPAICESAREHQRRHASRLQLDP